MSICNICGTVTKDAHVIMYHVCKQEFCRHGMTSWFNGECLCRVEFLKQENEKLREILRQYKNLCSPSDIISWENRVKQILNKAEMI